MRILTIDDEITLNGMSRVTARDRFETPLVPKPRQTSVIDVIVMDREGQVHPVEVRPLPSRERDSRCFEVELKEIVYIYDVTVGLEGSLVQISCEGRSVVSLERYCDGHYIVDDEKSFMLVGKDGDGVDVTESVAKELGETAGLLVQTHLIQALSELAA